MCIFFLKEREEKNIIDKITTFSNFEILRVLADKGWQIGMMNFFPQCLSYLYYSCLTYSDALICPEVFRVYLRVKQSFDETIFIRDGISVPA